MADHFSGPRALADPASDITDVFAFPSPERPGHLVLVLNVFPIAAPTALFSDALIYRFRLRPVTATRLAAHRRSWPAPRSGRSTSGSPSRLPAVGTRPARAPPSAQRSRSASATSSRPRPPGCAIFAGQRLDPFFIDLAAESANHVLERLTFKEPGINTGEGANCLSIVVEFDVATVLGPDTGPLLAVVGETLTAGHPRPAGAHGPAGDQELHPAGQEVRPRQPRPGDPRPLQRRGRLRPAPGLRRGLPRPAQRQSALLRPARRQDRLAARRAGQPPVDRAAAGRLPRRRHLQAVHRRQLPGDRARRARRPPAHHLRRPAAQRRHRRHPLHTAGRRRRRTADQRRRRPGDPARRPAAFPTCAAPTRIRRT